mgnify:CR=1 FL=1
MNFCTQNRKLFLNAKGQAIIEYLLLSILFFLLGIFVYKVISSALVRFFERFLFLRTGLAGIL